MSSSRLRKNQNCHSEGIRSGCPIEDSGSCRKKSQLQLFQSLNVWMLFTSNRKSLPQVTFSAPCSPAPILCHRGIASGTSFHRVAQKPHRFNFRVGDHPGVIAWWLESKSRVRPLLRVGRLSSKWIISECAVIREKSLCMPGAHYGSLIVRPSGFRVSCAPLEFRSREGWPDPARAAGADFGHPAADHIVAPRA